MYGLRWHINLFKFSKFKKNELKPWLSRIIEDLSHIIPKNCSSYFIGLLSLYKVGKYNIKHLICIPFWCSTLVRGCDTWPETEWQKKTNNFKDRVLWVNCEANKFWLDNTPQQENFPSTSHRNVKRYTLTFFYSKKKYFFVRVQKWRRNMSRYY